MCLFKKKKRKTFVVTKRSEDITPYVIPHISSKGSYEENPYSTFVSPTHGAEENTNIIPPVDKISNVSIDKYSVFGKDPIYKEDEPYHEFRKVRNTKDVTPISSLVNDIEETKEENITTSSFNREEIINEAKITSEVIINEEKEEEEFTFNYTEPTETVKNDDSYYKDLFGVTNEEEKKEIVVKKEIETIDENIEETTKEEKKVEEYVPLNDEYENSGYTIDELKLLRGGHKSPSYENYQNPSIDILDDPIIENTEDLEWISKQIEKINVSLEAYKIDGKVAEYTTGPTFTRYAIQLAPGVSGNKVENLSLDLQRSLEAMSLRIENPIPGKPYVGIEVPNRKRRTVALKELLNRDEYLNQAKPLTFPIGLDVEGKAKYISVTDLPHGLVAGASGSGKSVFLNTLITSLILKNSPEDLRFFFIDPKQVDLQAYAKIPHLLSPIIQEPQKGIESLKWLVNEMERRFALFRLAGVPNLKDYRRARQTRSELPNCPYIIMIIDEAGDFLMDGGNEAMNLVIKLIQKCRASGIHMFLSTQKPVAKTISSSIKSNASARFALYVANQTDSMVILDQGGAEKLLGNGDMIFSHPECSGRFQSAYVSNEEVRKITNAVQSQAPIDFYFNPDEIEKKSQGRSQAFKDDLFEDVARYVVNENRCSINAITREFGMGFNRTDSIVRALEEAGIIGPNTGTKAREVLVNFDELEEILERL